MTDSFTGTWALVRQGLRRDRVIVPVWLGLLWVMTFASAVATPALFSNADEQAALAGSMNAQPALVALYGPILDPSSIGELAMSKMTVLYAVAVAILIVIVVRRHTRVEEETGRAELLAAAVVGRDAPLSAAVAEALAISVVLGVGVGLANAVGGLPIAGSFWFGVVWAGTGAVAAAIAAIAVQLSSSARTCGAIASGAIAATYAMRAVGDATGHLWLSWLSPLGWNTQFRAWHQPRVWMVVLYAGFALIGLAVAYALRDRRDLGDGLVRARPGPTGSRIGSPLGLLVGNHRVSLLLWTTLVGGLALLFGSMIPSLDEMIRESGGTEIIDRLGGTMVAALLSVAAVVIAAYAMVVLGHVAGDETQHRVDLVLTAGASRRQWFVAACTVAGLGSAWLLLTAGTGLAVGQWLASGTDPWQAVGAALIWAPAVWLVAAVTLLAWSYRSRWVGSGWVVLGLCLTLTVFGELLEFPTWLIKLSPFSLVGRYPVEPVNWAAEFGLVAVTALLVFAAWLRFRARDIG